MPLETGGIFCQQEDKGHNHFTESDLYF